jgi:hypothetical protein
MIFLGNVYKIIQGSKYDLLNRLYEMYWQI